MDGPMRQCRATARARCRRGHGMRRVIAALVVALLPMACASDDAAQLESAARPTQSLFGNYLAGRHAQAARDLPMAVDFLRAALVQDPDNRNLLRRTFLLSAVEGHLEEAAALARRVVVARPGAPIANVVLVVDDLLQGRFAEADERLRALPAGEGMNVFLVPLLRAWSLVGMGKTEAALEALKPLKESSGLRAMYDLHAGLVYELAGRGEEAEKSYQGAVEAADGPSLRMIELLGALYERTDRPQAARALYRRYMDEHPSSQLMGPALARLEEGGVARRSVTSARDGAAEAMFGVSNSVRQRTSRDMALIFGRLALALKQRFSLAQILVADILEAEEHLERANAMYASIDPGSPFWWSARLSIASNLNRLDRTDEAVAQLRAMAKEDPTLADPFISLGDILRGRDRFDEAVQAYDEAFRRLGTLERRHWTLLYARGIALERSKRWERAEADFLKALEFEPDQPYVLNYLGYSWVDQGLNLERAREMIEKAVDLRPRDGYIVDSKGWALYRLGEYAAATRELERAVELRPEDPVINDHLGDAYWRVDRRREARFQWRRSLSLEPEPELRASAEAKLENGLAAESDGKTAADE